MLANLLAGGAQIAAEHGRTRLAIFLDLQEAPQANLVVIANAIQDALGTGNTPLAVFAAGLPKPPNA